MDSSDQNKQESNNIRIGITIGDINGIGPELIIRTLAENDLLSMFTPVIYGSTPIISYYKKMLSQDDFSYSNVKNINQIQGGRVNIVNCWNEDVKVEMGEVTSISGKCAYEALEAAVNDIKNNNIDVLVTAPFNKQGVKMANFDFPGHTEYLAHRFDNSNVIMLMCSSMMRVATVTGHVPVSKVSEMLNQELILKKIKTLNKSLQQDFCISKPKIAVLGLNPHAGDAGAIGNEDQEVIVPAINKAMDENSILVYGPFSADGFFAAGKHQQFDAVLAMYHDQGLIPFKALSHDGGVNFTAGIPIVRTSPDHGTAYDIVGKGKASLQSFRDALYLAKDIYRNRKRIEK